MSSLEKQAACDEAFATISATLPTRSRNNLANLKRALDHMVTVRATHYTAAQVERVMAELGIRSPSKKAIYNAEGVHFRDLIAQYAAQYGGPAGQAVARSDRDRFVVGIQDQALRSKVQRLFDDNDVLRRENGALKALVARLQRVDPKALLALAQGVEAPAPVVAGLTIDPLEAAAARDFLQNADELLDVRWEPSGALVSDRGEVAGPRFRALLERAVALPGDALADTRPPNRLPPAAAAGRGRAEGPPGRR